MKKRLVVDVLIDDTVSEEEILTRVDDILADCALRPAEFTDLELDPNNPIVWDDEDDPANIPGWQPTPGTALDYVYRKKYLDKHGFAESSQGRDFKKKLEEGNKLKKALLATAMAAGLMGATPKMYANTPKSSKGQQTATVLDSNKEIEKADLGSIKTYTGLVNQEYCPLIRDFIEEYLKDTKKEIVDASFIKMTKSNIIDSLSESFPESTDEEIEDVVDGVFIMALKGTGKKAKTKISPEAVPLFSESWRDTATLFAK